MWQCLKILEGIVEESLKGDLAETKRSLASDDQARGEAGQSAARVGGTREEQGRGNLGHPRGDHVDEQ